MTADHNDFFIIQYVRDIIRQEGRNIGVMLFLDREARFYALGQVDRQTTDPEPFLAVSRLPSSAGWFYQEWINWFHELAENEGCEPINLQNQLLELDEQGSPFIAKAGGVITIEPEEPPEITLKELFQQVVGKSGKGTKGEFLSRLGALMASLNLRQEPGFVEDAEIEFLPVGQPAVTLRVPFLIDPPSGPRTVFKIVRTKTSADAFLRQVSDAAHAFRYMSDHGFATRDRCIVLTERASNEKLTQLEYLSSFAHVVSINDANAFSSLERILKPSSP